MTDTHNPPRTPVMVVGVDGSDSSLEALRRAVRLAPTLNAAVEAVAVWEFPRSMYDVYTPDPGWSPEADAGRILAEATAAVFGGDVPPWYRTKTLNGSAARTLIEASTGAEMLVLGSRGHGGFVGLLLGSVSAACAHHAHCPVLIVRPETSPKKARPTGGERMES